MILALLLALLAQDGNRLAYLDDSDPYYVGRSFPALMTPQWFNEDTDAVIILAIDDMRGHEKWETYLRPILERLKKIDGRAPVSIMTCSIDPNHAQLQKWLKEGLSIEVHTVDHPCPLLKDNDFLKAKSTYDRCVELMHLIPNNKPVAFRMPCCDSLNTPSPRFYSQIFNSRTSGGRFLTIDSSVCNVTTSADPDVPKALTIDAEGKERFRKYLPFPSFVNTIENYPYPYVIGKYCWEFPCAVPSDWEAQNINKPFSPVTVDDMKASIDAVVAKRGVFNFVFHPHGWIKPEQVIELIDHVVLRYGSRVKFITFREALERLDATFGRLRHEDGGDGLTRVLDPANDGRLRRQHYSGGRYGVFRKGGVASYVTKEGAWTYQDGAWKRDPELGTLESEWTRFRDLDGDGVCEMLARDGVFKLDRGWKLLPFTLPVSLASRGYRFVDLNGDGRADIVHSDERDWAVYVWKDLDSGWVRAAGGSRTDADAIPMISRNGLDNGAWFHSGHLWVQNEDTAKMKDLVDRRSFAELLQKK